MSNVLTIKSKIPLQFRAFHTILGFVIFFSLIRVPAQAQIIDIFGTQLSSEYLWLPVLFFILQLIYKIYGFPYLRHAIFLSIVSHAIYILFLKFAIWLPAASFWKIQSTYEHVLGRDYCYIVKNSFFFWACILLPVKYLPKIGNRLGNYIFFISLIVFSLINFYWINFTGCHLSSLILPFLLFSFLTIFSRIIIKSVKSMERVEVFQYEDNHLLSFRLPNIKEDKVFQYHHILFCSSILFFITSKTMAAKFISIGFVTINVGGVVFSLAYLIADMMTDVYGIERTKQMIRFVIFCNLLLVFDVWITNLLAVTSDISFSKILHNQGRMFIASSLAYILGMTINSTVISLIKSRQRKMGISLKKEFITTLWTRIASSSALGIILDVTFFSFVAFYDIVPNEKLANVILIEDTYKILYEILLAPVSILLIYFLKVREKVDIYDEQSNLNPFRIDTNYKDSANKFYENFIGLKDKNER